MATFAVAVLATTASIGCGGSGDWETLEPPAILTAPDRPTAIQTAVVSLQSTAAQGPEIEPPSDPGPEPTLAPPPSAAVHTAQIPIPPPLPPDKPQAVVLSGVEQWRGLVESIFPAFAVEAVLRIIRCESGGDPNATGAAGERGLLQVHPLHFDSTYDPVGNLLAAYRISGAGTSWAAWSCR